MCNGCSKFVGNFGIPEIVVNDRVIIIVYLH